MASQEDDNKIECISNINKQQERYFLNVYKKHEYILNSKSDSFENKIESLVDVWKSVGELNLSQFDLRHVIQIMDWAKLHALNIVLTAEWNGFKDTYESKLLGEIEKAQNELLKLNSAFATRCKKLADVVKNPWEDPILMKLMKTKDAEITSEEIEFFCVETAYLVSVRLKKLCESHCEDLALNLVTAFMNCNKLSKTQNFSLNATETQMWFIFDIYIALLYKFQEKQKIVVLLKELTFAEGLLLVKRFAKKRVKISKIWKNCHRIAILAVQLYTSQTVVKYTVEVKDFLENYIEIYISLCNTDTLLQDFSTSIRRISNLADASGLYVFCGVIQRKAGSKLKPLVIEMYIRALTTDMNELERQKDANEVEKVAETTSRLAAAFCNLADFLDEHVKVARECVLTAFSLEPNKERLECIETLARRSGFQVLDTGQEWKCKLHPPTLPSDDITWVCPECGDWMSKPEFNVPIKINMALNEALQNSILGISEALCDDLVVCLSNPRYQILSWFLPWEDLHRLCLMYLQDPQATKNIVTELKFVDIDYSIFKGIKREPLDELEGIERGYEQYLDQDFVSDEETTSNSEDSMSQDSRPYSLGSDGAGEGPYSMLPVQTKSDPNTLKSLRMFRPNLKRTREKDNSEENIPGKLYKPDSNNLSIAEKVTTSIPLKTEAKASTSLNQFLNGITPKVSNIQYPHSSTSLSVSSAVNAAGVMDFQSKNVKTATLPLLGGQVAKKESTLIQVTNQHPTSPEETVSFPSNNPVHNQIDQKEKKDLRILIRNKLLLNGSIENSYNIHNNNKNKAQDFRLPLPAPKVCTKKYTQTTPTPHSVLVIKIPPLDYSQRLPRPKENSKLDQAQVAQPQQPTHKLPLTYLCHQQTTKPKLEKSEICQVKQPPWEKTAKCTLEKSVNLNSHLGNRSTPVLSQDLEPQILNKSKNKDYQSHNSLPVCYMKRLYVRLTKLHTETQKFNQNQKLYSQKREQAPMNHLTNCQQTKTRIKLPNSSYHCLSLNQCSHFQDQTQNPSADRVKQKIKVKKLSGIYSNQSHKMKLSQKIGKIILGHSTMTSTTPHPPNKEAYLIPQLRVRLLRQELTPTKCSMNKSEHKQIKVPQELNSNLQEASKQDLQIHHVANMELESMQVISQSLQKSPFQVDNPETNQLFQCDQSSPSVNLELSNLTSQSLPYQTHKNLENSQVTQSVNRNSLPNNYCNLLTVRSLCPSSDRSLTFQNQQIQVSQETHITEHMNESGLPLSQQMLLQLTVKPELQTHTEVETESTKQSDLSLNQKMLQSQPVVEPDLQTLVQTVTEYMKQLDLPLGQQPLETPPTVDLEIQTPPQMATEPMEQSDLQINPQMQETPVLQTCMQRVTEDMEVSQLLVSQQVQKTHPVVDLETQTPLQRVTEHTEQLDLQKVILTLRETEVMEELDLPLNHQTSQTPRVTGSMGELDLTLRYQMLQTPRIVDLQTLTPTPRVTESMRESYLPLRQQVVEIQPTLDPEMQIPKKLSGPMGQLNQLVLQSHRTKVQLPTYPFIDPSTPTKLNITMCKASTPLFFNNLQVPARNRTNLNWDYQMQKNFCNSSNITNRNNTPKINEKLVFNNVDKCDINFNITMDNNDTNFENDMFKDNFDYSKYHFYNIFSDVFDTDNTDTLFYKSDPYSVLTKNECIENDDPQEVLPKNKNLTENIRTYMKKKLKKKLLVEYKDCVKTLTVANALDVCKNVNNINSTPNLHSTVQLSSTKRRELKIILCRLPWNKKNDERCTFTSEEKNYSIKQKCDRGKTPPKNIRRRKSFDKSENKVGKAPNLVQNHNLLPLQDVNLRFNSQINYKACCGINKSVVVDEIKSGIISEKIDYKKRFVKTLLSNVPGLNDFQMIRPSNVNPVVNVVQVSGGRSNQSVSIQNSQTSTQVTPHIQRIGQPRVSDQKPDHSNSPTLSTQTTSTTNATSRTTTSQPSTLINILSQQIIRPVTNQVNAVRRQGPLINILSQQIIRPTLTPKTTLNNPNNTPTVTDETQGKVTVSAEQTILNSAIKSTNSVVKNTNTVTSGQGGTILQFICKSSLPKFQQAFGKAVYQNSSEIADSPSTAVEINNSGNSDTKKTITAKSVPVNVQPIQGSVIYSRQVPVGQTISLIPPGGTTRQVFRIATSNPEQISLVKDTVIHSKMSALLAAALQTRPKNADGEIHLSCDEIKGTVTRPALVQGARIVKPVQLQLPSNVVRANPQPNLSSTTLEQLREFDMVYKQIKERSNTNPSDSNTSGENQDAPQRISVTYVNQVQKYTQLSPVVVVTSYNNLQPAASPALSVTSQGSSSPCVTPASTPTLQKIPNKNSKGKTLKTSPTSTTTTVTTPVTTTNTTITTTKSSPVPKPQQKPQEDEHTTQRIFDILAEYAEQLRNSPDLNNKPAPRRRSNPPTNPSHNSKRKKSSSGVKKSGQSNSSLDMDTDDLTLGSEDSSGGGVVQLSVTDDEQSQASASATTTDTNDTSSPPNTRPVILAEGGACTNQSRNLIIADSSVGEALKMSNTAVIVPSSYIMPVSMVKGGQQIAVVSGGSKILATVPARSGQNMLLFQSFTNQNRKGAISAVKYSTIQPISGLSTQTLTGVSGQQPMILPSNSVATAVAIGQPLTLKKKDDRETGELLLTLSQPKDKSKNNNDIPQPDSSTSISSDSVDFKIDDSTSQSDNSSEKVFHTYQKTVINSVETSVIATTSTSKQVGCNSNQTIINANASTSIVKVVEQKSGERLQSVLVTACSSNGPMLSHITPRYRKTSDNTRTHTSELPVNKGDFLHNGEKVNNEQKNFRGNTAYYVNKNKKVTAESQKMDSELQKQAAIERELRLQKSLSEECEDLGVDEPSTSDLFPEADLLFDSNHSPSFDQTSQDIIKKGPHVEVKEEVKEAMNIFSDDENSGSLRTDLFEYVEYPPVNAALDYQRQVNGNNTEASSPGCDDNTLLPKCATMSEVTLNSPISPEMYQETNMHNKYKFKYSNRKKGERIKQTEQIVTSSEETVVCTELANINCEDNTYKLVNKTKSDIVKEEATCELHCDDDVDSPSGRGARRSVRKLCSCCNGSQDGNLAKKRPHTSRPHTPATPHKKAFLTKKR